MTFRPIGRDGSMTWAESLAANHTDGILILHRGRIVYERYFGAVGADRQHLAFSVTKSFVATVAATLIAEGTPDAGATVVSYLPELRSSARGGAKPAHTAPASRTHWFIPDVCRRGALRVSEAYWLHWRDCQLITLKDEAETEVLHVRVLGKHLKGGKREDGYGLFRAVSSSSLVCAKQQMA